MKLHVIYSVIILIASLVSFACAGRTPLPKQIPDAMKSACELYTKVKPQVEAGRAWAVQHWDDKVPGTDKDLIPADVKKILQELDSYLPKLDQAGLAICAASEGLEALQAHEAANGKVDWNVVFADLLKAASFAMDLKSKGVI